MTEQTAVRAFARRRLGAAACAAVAAAALGAPAARGALVFQATAKDYNAGTNTFAPDVGPAGTYGLSDIASSDTFMGTLAVDAKATPTGASALSFDGNSGVEFPANVLSGPDQSGGGQMTIFAVVRPSGNTSSPQTIVAGGGGSLQYRIDDTGTNAGEQAVLNRGNFQFGNSSTVVSSTAFSVIEVVLTNASVPTASFYANGTFVGDAGATYDPSQLNGIARLGEAQDSADGTVNNEAFRGDIAEVRVYDTALGTTDRQAVEASLRSTYIQAAAVPEPATAALAVAAAAGGLAGRRRRAAAR